MVSSWNNVNISKLGMPPLSHLTCRVIFALLRTCEKRLLNEHGVKMQAAKQVLVVLKSVSAGCFSLSEDMARVFLQNMSRDLGKLREMLKKKTRVKALDYLSRVGLLWLFIRIWLCCSPFTYVIIHTDCILHCFSVAENSTWCRNSVAQGPPEVPFHIQVRPPCCSKTFLVSFWNAVDQGFFHDVSDARERYRSPVLLTC